MAYCYRGSVSSSVIFTSSGNQILNNFNLVGSKDSFCFYGMYDKKHNWYCDHKGKEKKRIGIFCNHIIYQQKESETTHTDLQ